MKAYISAKQGILQILFMCFCLSGLLYSCTSDEEQVQEELEQDADEADAQDQETAGDDQEEQQEDGQQEDGEEYAEQDEEDGQQEDDQGEEEEYVEEGEQEDGEEYVEQGEEEDGEEYVEEGEQEEGEEYVEQEEDADSAPAEYAAAATEAGTDAMAAVAEAVPTGGLAPAGGGEVRYVSVASLNVRNAPDMNGQVVGQLEKGDHIVVNDMGEWAQLSNGTYVYAASLSKQGVGRQKRANNWRGSN